MKEKRKIELLAPAQNKKCAKTAIDCGADSIYMGANLYGARQNASNSIEDIEEVINYAHKFNTKVYITLNTILDDKELLEAEKIIKRLHKIKADGIIFQDMGILKLAYDGKLPDIKLIASTQCDNRDIDKVKFFEKTGVKRVILARELSLDVIKKICDSTNIEIETFIHGALCVSYSGQCYLSYRIGKRSSNRGECAQACRKKYTLISEDGKILAKDKYLLSLKDFMAAEHLEELINAGVISFKIEGRLKDENYIKNTVLFYRRFLDEIILRRNDIVKASSGKVFSDFKPDLNKSFNRDFCQYFLDGRKNNIYNFDAPNSKGEYLGTVDKVCKDFFTIKKEGMKESFKSGRDGCIGGKTDLCDRGRKDSCVNLKGTPDIHPQDGLCYLENGALKGFLVNSVDGNKIFPNNMPKFSKGAKIYRNKDSNFENNLQKAAIRRQIGVEFRIYNGFIECIDEDNNIISVNFGNGEEAKNQDMARKTWVNCLSKTGTSDFYVTGVKFLGTAKPIKPCKTVENKADAPTEAMQDKPGKNSEYSEEDFAQMPHCTKYTTPCKEQDYKGVENIDGRDINSVCFLPQSKINALRRKILEKLSEFRVQNYKLEGQGKITPAEYPEKSGDWRLNVHNREAEKFYNECNCKVKEYSLESGINSQGKELMRTKHCIRYALNMCLKKQADLESKKISDSGIGRGKDYRKRLFLTDEKGVKYALNFDCKNCEMTVLDIGACSKNSAQKGLK